MKIYIAAFLLFLSGFLPAQESLTLQQAIETGLKNNYSILIERNNAAIATNNHSAGNAGMLPRLDATLIQNNSTTDTKQRYSAGNEVDRTGAESNSLNGLVELNWTVFDGLRMFAAYNRLGELQKAGELNARLAVENAVQEIIAAYFDIVKQQALLQVIDSSRNISAVKLNIAKTKFDVGITSKVEFLQAQVDMNADESAFKRQLVVIEQSKIRLNQLLARSVVTQFNVTDSILVTSDQALDNALASAEQNTSYLLAQRFSNAGKHSINEVRGERFPWLGLNAGYSYLNSESESSFVLENTSSGFNYGFTVNWTLFNGFNVNRRIKNAKLDFQNLQLQTNEVKNAVDAEIVIAFRNLQNNLEILALEETNAALAQENISLALERFRVGALDELSLKEAQQSFNEAQNRLVNIRYDAKVAETNLRRLTGKLL